MITWPAAPQSPWCPVGRAAGLTIRAARRGDAGAVLEHDERREVGAVDDQLVPS